MTAILAGSLVVVTQKGTRKEGIVERGGEKDLRELLVHAVARLHFHEEGLAALLLGHEEGEARAEVRDDDGQDHN